MENRPKKLLDQVRDAIRVIHHASTTYPPHFTP